MTVPPGAVSFFFFNDTATTEIYTLSLHDALPICWGREYPRPYPRCADAGSAGWPIDRKSTRLNSSHQIISYAVFCLKKKKKHNHGLTPNHTPPPATYPQLHPPRHQRPDPTKSHPI